MPQHTYTIKNNERFKIMKVKKEKEFIKTKINWIQIQMLHKKIPQKYYGKKQARKQQIKNTKCLIRTCMLTSIYIIGKRLIVISTQLTQNKSIIIVLLFFFYFFAPRLATMLCQFSANKQRAPASSEYHPLLFLLIKQPVILRRNRRSYLFYLLENQSRVPFYESEAIYRLLCQIFCVSRFSTVLLVRWQAGTVHATRWPTVVTSQTIADLETDRGLRGLTIHH